MTTIEALRKLVTAPLDHPHQIRTGYRVIFGRTPRPIRYQLPKARSLHHWAELYDTRRKAS